MIVGKCYESSLEHSYIKDPLLPLLVGGFYFINYYIMEKTEGQITSNVEGGTRTDFLFTYSDIERRENTANKHHSDALLNLEFVKFQTKYVGVLSTEENLLLSFFEFYKGGIFYYNNEQYGKVFGRTDKQVQRIIKSLSDKGCIKVAYKKVVGLGTMRKISFDHTEDILSGQSGHFVRSDDTILSDDIYDKELKDSKEINNTSIINGAGAQNLQQPLNSLVVSGEEKKKKSSAEKEKKKPRQDIDELIGEIKAVCNEYGIAYDKKCDRNFARHILDAKEFGDFCDSIGQSRMNFAVNVLIASIKINYFKGACSGPMKIYQNYAEVYNQTAMKHNKQSSLVGFLPGLNIG